MFFFSRSRKCFESIGKDNLNDAFINFYSQFNTKDEQDLFLHGLIDVTDIVRKKPGSRDSKGIVMMPMKILYEKEKVTVETKRNLSTIF